MRCQLAGSTTERARVALALLGLGAITLGMALLPVAASPKPARCEATRGSAGTDAVLAVRQPRAIEPASRLDFRTATRTSVMS